MGGYTADTLKEKKHHARYPAKEHLASVVKYLPDGLKSNYILLTGAKEIPIGTSDSFYPFIQESFFYYCSGLPYPDCLLLYDIKNAHLTLFIPPPRQGRDAVYLGQRPSSKHISTTVECDSILLADESLPSLLESIGGIFYTLHDAELLTALVRARSIKSPYELHLLRLAASVSDAGHAQVAKCVKWSSTEQTLDTAFRTTCAAQRPLGAGARGGLKYSYTPIVASGSHASTLHYTCAPGVDTPLHGDLVLVDAAASIQYYASDITRTLPRNGTFTDRARTLYELVLSMQEASIAVLKPGQYMSDAARASHEILTHAMVQYKWVTCDVETARKEGLSRYLLMHGIGHHVGIDVHDVTPVRAAAAAISRPAAFTDLPIHGTSSSSSLSRSVLASTNESPLEEGNVVTIEPGVYFNTEFLAAAYDTEAGKYLNKKEIEAWSHLGGVRIEDVILITKDGHEVLSHAAKSVKDVEALCQTLLQEPTTTT